MAERELDLTTPESVTNVSGTNNYDKVRLNRIQLIYGSKELNFIYSVGKVDGSYTPYRIGETIMISGTNFDSMVDGKTDEEIQDGIFDKLVTDSLVGTGTKQDVS